MNFFDSALSMARTAYEHGAAAASEAVTRVQNATGVELPVPLQMQSATTSKQTQSNQQATSTKKAETTANGKAVEEEKDESEHLGRINFKLDYSFDKATLLVTVVQAEELPAMDIGGTSDPYVKLYVLPDKKKKFFTKKLKKTLNPVYNETFTFNKLPFNEISNKTLVFQIYDHDAVGADDQIGQVTVPLGKIDLASENLEFWRDIKDPPKNVLGDICLSLRYAPQKRPPQLNVIVIECKNLKQMDIGGASDPYVKLNHMVNGKRVKKYKTPVRMADLNPYYNQSFKIEVNPHEMGKTELHVYVMDFDKIGSNDCIGWLNFSLKDQGTPGQHWRAVLSNPKKSIAQWHALQPIEDDK